MTTDLIELSKQAAEVLGIEPKEIYPSHFIFSDKTSHSSSTTWLAEDNGRCAEIANGRMLNTRHYTDAVMVEYVDESLIAYRRTVYLSSCHGDRNAAWRVAVLETVIEQGKMG